VAVTQAHRTGALQSYKVTDNVESERPPTHARGKFEAHGSVHRNSMLIKIQPEATKCEYLFTAKSFYIFRVSQHPSSVLKTVTAASGTGHNTGAATSLQRDLIRPRWREVAAPVL